MFGMHKNQNLEDLKKFVWNLLLPIEIFCQIDGPSVIFSDLVVLIFEKIEFIYGQTFINDLNIKI